MVVVDFLIRLTSRGLDNLVGSTPPVESEISLSFKELEIITQNNVGRGF